ncbi:MAG: hypothetical protein IPJ94_11035 [Chloroflexi bacterium]|nr:hypothetical protein [Chloroflexota bacterium]
MYCAAQTAVVPQGRRPFVFFGGNMFPNLVTYHIHRAEPLPPNDALAYQYVLAGNGLFIRAETRFFAACIPIAAAVVRGLPLLAAQFQLRVPRLPARLLEAILADARRARRSDGAFNEALYQFHHHGQTVQVTKPPQRATGVSVLAAGENAPTVFCDLHPHGAMAAFSAPPTTPTSRGRDCTASWAGWTASQRCGCGWGCLAIGSHCRSRPCSPAAAPVKICTRRNHHDLE